jgi:hypothetical protein
MVHSPQSSPLTLPNRFPSTKTAPSIVDLGQIREWILSLTDQDHELLQYAREYSDFIDAASRLKRARQHIVQTWNIKNDASRAKDCLVCSKTSFLQNILSDEAVSYVLDYLESISLMRIATTCTRLRNLVYQNAKSRCKGIERERQQTDVIRLLCAKEQIEGFYSNFLSNRDGMAVPTIILPSVRIPILLPGRKVLVTEAGDSEFNGVYFCTGCNGNGFVFTKPRYPLQTRSARYSDRDKEQASCNSRNLNCIFARRFSGQVRSCLR